MNCRCNRRQFLGAAAVSTVSLAGFSALARAASKRTTLPAGALASVHLITGSALRGSDPRCRTWIYLAEILSRAGVFFESHEADQIERIIRVPGAILVLGGNISLTAKQRGAIDQWVKDGGSLLGLGGSSGLKDVFGIASETPLAEAWIRPTNGSHPILNGLRSSLHVFGGHTLMPASGTVLAGIEGGSAYVKGNSIVEHRFGKGRAVLFGPDLVFSIVHIQQGIPVLQDARPPADASAAVNDGVLKAEDGSVLDWARDRSAVQPDGRIFLEPVADELRELILRSLFYLASQAGASMPLLWQWPGSARAVATMSHDTDGNDPAKAVALLDVVKRCNLKTTWCILYPGGYPKPFYRDLADAECEIALHYDAMTGGEKTSWSWENFLFQQQWLMREAGVGHITTNKNHYTRWEGRSDLWRWCEKVGIRSDQTRGPSKKGTIGFPLGGSQPYFPLDLSSDRSRFMDVLEVNLLTQDLVVTCPPEYGPQLVDSALRHNGVAHFLFHPAHIQKPGVAEALDRVVSYARSEGLEWWTSKQIVDWETRRRSVKGKLDSHGLRLRREKDLSDATLLFLRPDNRSGAIGLNGQTVASKPWELYGFQFDAVTAPISSETRADWRPS